MLQLLLALFFPFLAGRIMQRRNAPKTAPPGTTAVDPLPAASDAVTWNRQRRTQDEWRAIQSVLGRATTGEITQTDCDYLAGWQKSVGLTPDGKAGGQTLGCMRVLWTSIADVRTLDDAQAFEVLSSVYQWESGGNPAALNLDREFKGGFGAEHWAAGKYHVGVSWGIIQWAQGPGSLATVTEAIYDKVPGIFEEAFDGRAAAVVEMLGRRGDYGDAGDPSRKPNTYPVDGYDLWEGPWPDRWRRLAAYPEVQQIQRDVAISSYVLPAAREALSHGMSTMADVCVCMDVATQFGRNGFRTRLGRVDFHGDRGDVIRLIRELDGPSDERTRKLRARRALLLGSLTDAQMRRAYSGISA